MGNNIVNISFYPVPFFKKNYYLKITYKDKRIYGETDNTIAITESEGYYIKVENPKSDKNGKYQL